MLSPIKPRNKVKIKKQKVLDAYFATEETKKEYETKTIVHIVGKTSKASSLSSIAKAYKGVSWKDIQKENKMGKSTTIHPKQKLNITTKVEKGKKLSFKKLSKANLGDEVYIIVKTLNLEGKQIQLNVRQGKVKGIEKENEPIKLHQNGKDTYIPEEKVGNYSTKKDITNATDFKEWAIFKVILGSKEDKKLKAYKENIEKLKDKKTSLFLVIDAHSKSGLTVIYNGRNPDKDGEPDDRTTPNYWLDMEGKWFELKKNQRAPWMEIAYNELGVEEIAGKKHNVQILEYHKSAGVVDYKNKKGLSVKITDDKNWPWCSSFVCWVFSKTNKYSGKITAKATNWKNWGKSESKEKPMYGALAVIDWGKNDNKAGHVGFIVKADKKHYYLLGGNQTGGDKKTNGKVCIGRYKKSVIDYIRIPSNYTPSKNDYKYDEIKLSNNGFESLSSTR